MSICLNQYTSLSLHWSSDCNIACSYCYIKKDKPCMASLNKKICQALSDGSYLHNIKQRFVGYENQINSLSLWGAEPTINGIYFKNFITDFLDHFVNTSKIFFSTNAKVGGEKILTYFINPLLEYCENHNRYMTIHIQFSLDGPAWINDSSRYPGATSNTIAAVDYLLDNIPENNKLIASFSTKPTLDVSYMKIMCEEGVTAIQRYYQFLSDTYMQWEVKARDKYYINLSPVTAPTLVDPGDYSKDDGIIFAKWVSYLSQLDFDKLPAFKNVPVFWQAVRGLELVLNKKNIITMSHWECSCSAGHTDITIDYLGNLYTCERLAKNLAYENEYHPILEAHSTVYNDRIDFNKKLYANLAFHHTVGARRNLADAIMLLAAKSGEIDYKYYDLADERTLLFYATFGLMCHIGIEEDLNGNMFVFPLSYTRLLGNGAVDELIKYYYFERRRMYEQESDCKQ